MKQFIALSILFVLFFWGCESSPTDPNIVVDNDTMYVQGPAVHDTVWGWIGLDTVYYTIDTSGTLMDDTVFVECFGSVDMKVGIHYYASWTQKDLTNNTGKLRYQFSLKYFGSVESMPVAPATVVAYLDIDNLLVETIEYLAYPFNGVWIRGERYPASGSVTLVTANRYDLGVSVYTHMSATIIQE